MSGFRKATFMLVALVQGGFAFAESATPNMADLPLPARAHSQRAKSRRDGLTH